MTRNIRTEWTPSAKNAGRAYGAILTGLGMAFDQGFHYTSYRFIQLLKDADLRQSMSKTRQLLG